jgi:hypothetical protein
MGRTMKPIKEIHVSKTGKASGDYYGTGVKQKVGKIRGVPSINPKGKDMGKPPKSLA